MSPSGTPRYKRYANDLASGTHLLSSLDAIISDFSIRDCYRLGTVYDSNRCRPILVKMNRPGDVSCILAQRTKLANRIGISIKPDLSLPERKILTALLKERKK